jgi:hypothetical protein
MFVKPTPSMGLLAAEPLGVAQWQIENAAVSLQGVGVLMNMGKFRAACLHAVQKQTGPALLHLARTQYAYT